MGIFKAEQPQQGGSLDSNDSDFTERITQRVVVVTAADEARTDFLMELTDSIHTQDVPDGFDVMWSVRFDGENSIEAANSWRAKIIDIGEGSSLSSVIVGANGVRRGTATTRTMALYGVPACDWVISVDADDLLAPGALAALCAGSIDAKKANARFVSGKSVRFGVDEQGEPWSSPRPDVFASGLLARGEIVKQARDGELAPVTPNTILYDAQLIEALGGWPAVVSAEDLGLLYPVSEMFDGWRIDDVVLLRRRWEGQVTSGYDKWHETEHDLFVDAAFRRAECARIFFSF
jgi:hypothetical protein